MRNGQPVGAVWLNPETDQTAAEMSLAARICRTTCLTYAADRFGNRPMSDLTSVRVVLHQPNLVDAVKFGQLIANIGIATILL